MFIQKLKSVINFKIKEKLNKSFFFNLLIKLLKDI